MSILFTLLAALLLGAPDVLVFSEVSHDFGSQPKSVNVLTHDFSFTNASAKPVSISYAVATCSCTKLKWTTTAVAPGASGVVTATYYREQSRDSFEKFISVFVDGVTKPFVLRIAGSFYDTESSLAHEFPINLSGLGVKREMYDLGVLHPGDVHSSGVKLANLTGEDIHVGFTGVSDSLRIFVPISLMTPMSQKEFRYQLAVDSLVWGERFYDFTPMVNGKATKPMTFKVTVLDDYSTLSEAELRAGPTPVLEDGPCSFGTIGSGKQATASFSILNKSDKPLIIKRVYANDVKVRIDAPSRIGPGKSARFKFTAPASSLRKGRNTFQVSIISNSPAYPLKKVLVDGKVE